jgi:4-aminobutyrate aminotransferase-like enzyme
MGLMQALELVEDPRTRAPAPVKAAALLEATREEGLLVGKGGLYGNVIRLSPPMLIEADEVDDALARLGRVLARI